MDINAIFAAILGILLLIRGWWVKNYFRMKKGENKLSFGNYFNMILSPTGFITLLLILPVSKPFSRINILTFFIYLYILAFILYKVL